MRYCTALMAEAFLTWGVAGAPISMEGAARAGAIRENAKSKFEIFMGKQVLKYVWKSYCREQPDFTEIA